jgi:hypothetical protein
MGVSLYSRSLHSKNQNQENTITSSLLMVRIGCTFNKFLLGHLNLYKATRTYWKHDKHCI